MRVPAAAIHFPEEDRQEIPRRIDECLKSGQLTLGSIGKELEAEFAAAHDTPHAIAVSSGTSALEIPLRVLEAAQGEVLVQANSFFATAAAVLSSGARLRFVDCDPATMSLDPAAVEAAIGPDTVGVVTVHIGGYVPPTIRELQRICSERGLWLVEDAAHAHGSAYEGQKAGTFGAAGSFSFYPTKVIAGGEGGMITTADDRIAAEALIYRDQGKASFDNNDHTRLGYNWRMSEPHAAITLSQLRRLDEFVDHRRAIAARYDELLVDSPLRPLAIPAESYCNYYKYIAFLPDGVDRRALKQRLREEFQVALSGEVYETPLHLQSVFTPYADGPLPGAEQLCARHVCLPVSAVMTEDQADLVVESLHAALAG